MLMMTFLDCRNVRGSSLEVLDICRAMYDCISCSYLLIELLVL